MDQRERRKYTKKMTKEEINRDIEAYKVLDRKLINIMNWFWNEYPLTKATFSGSVLHGEWRVHRSMQFDGLKFKLSDQQMSDLALNNSCIVYEKDLINQKKLTLEELHE